MSMVPFINFTTVSKGVVTECWCDLTSQPKIAVRDDEMVGAQSTMLEYASRRIDLPERNKRGSE